MLCHIVTDCDMLHVIFTESAQWADSVIVAMSVCVSVFLSVPSRVPPFKCFFALTYETPR